jgi:hypothetical protein
VSDDSDCGVPDECGLTWTTERPTEPGWYWARGRKLDHDGSPEIVELHRMHYPWTDQTKPPVYWGDVYAGSPVTGYDGETPRVDEWIEWYGPLTPPA